MYTKEPSADACQVLCADYFTCTHWTWLPPDRHTNQGSYKNRCYLKNKRENFTPSDTNYTYISGSKYCPDVLRTYPLKGYVPA